MLTHLRPAIVMIVLFTALTGIVYPLAITGIAQVALKGPADGSTLTRNGVVVGSALVGQNFVSDRYFHGRPSATTAADPNDASKTVDAPYNASNSAGSNFGPTSQKLVDRVKASIATLGGSPAKPVPADAVATSASGLDPDISLAYATLQVPRVAEARKMPVDKLQAIIADNANGSGLFGERTLNTLRLNLALDAADGANVPAPPAAKPLAGG